MRLKSNDENHFEKIQTLCYFFAAAEKRVGRGFVQRCRCNIRKSICRRCSVCHETVFCKNSVIVGAGSMGECCMVHRIIQIRFKRGKRNCKCDGIAWNTGRRSCVYARGICRNDRMPWSKPGMRILMSGAQNRLYPNVTPFLLVIDATQKNGCKIPGTEVRKNPVYHRKNRWKMRSRTHNPKVVGSNPASATILTCQKRYLAEKSHKQAVCGIFLCPKLVPGLKDIFRPFWALVRTWTNDYRFCD